MDRTKTFRISDRTSARAVGTLAQHLRLLTGGRECEEPGVDAPYRRAVFADVLSGGGVLGDYNQNGIVDAGDYAVWQSNFGHTAGSGSFDNTAVPEPSTFLLLVLTLVGFGPLRRRHPAMRQVLNA
jgi:hypothetical protein